MIKTGSEIFIYAYFRALKEHPGRATIERMEKQIERELKYTELLIKLRKIKKTYNYGKNIRSSQS